MYGLLAALFLIQKIPFTQYRHLEQVQQICLFLVWLLPFVRQVIVSDLS